MKKLLLFLCFPIFAMQAPVVSVWHSPDKKSIIAEVRREMPSGGSHVVTVACDIASKRALAGIILTDGEGKGFFPEPNNMCGNDREICVQAIIKLSEVIRRINLFKELPFADGDEQSSLPK